PAAKEEVVRILRMQPQWRRRDRRQTGQQPKHRPHADKCTAVTRPYRAASALRRARARRSPILTPLSAVAIAPPITSGSVNEANRMIEKLLASVARTSNSRSAITVAMLITPRLPGAFGTTVANRMIVRTPAATQNEKSVLKAFISAKTENICIARYRALIRIVR